MVNLLYDNIIFALQQAGGGSSYWFEIISRAMRDSDVHCRFIDPAFKSSSKNIFFQKLSQVRDVERVEKIPPKLSRYLPVSVSSPGNSIFHSSLYRSSQSKGLKQIVTVHDFIYERLRSGPARTIHSLQKTNAIARSHAVICVSNYTKRDFFHFYPNYPADRVFVVHNGISELFASKDNCPSITRAHSDEALFIGDRSSYKRFDVAVKSVSRVEGLNLTVVGGGPLNKLEANLLQRFLPNRFKHLSWVDSFKLRELYETSFCLLYPSEYEGFGIPVIEAMGSGCPVIARKATSIVEISSSSALLSDSSDPEEYAALLETLKDISTRELLTERGLLNSQKFSWQKCFDQTKHIYQRIEAGEFD